jgi:energy-coupling factor transporter transmembrane protein EcfT
MLLMFFGFFILIAFVILFLVLASGGLVLIQFILAYFFKKEIKIKYALKVIFFTPIVVVILGFIILFLIEFMKSPMHVSKRKLNGNYSIDKEMFKGKNANWQHAHYELNVKDYVMTLKIKDNGHVIKEYSQALKPINTNKHSFFNFHGNYYGDNNTDEIELKNIITDSINHHMLRYNPRLLVEPFQFYIVLRSTKYGNMYFIKQ